MISRESFGAAFQLRPLAEVADFLNDQREPLKSSERNPGPYPYFGANGRQGTMDAYLFDEPLVLLAEDGGFFAQPERGIAYRISGKTWVNNHAHVIRPKDGMDLAFLCRVLENYDVSPYISGSTRAKLTKEQAAKIEIPCPPFAVQKRIAAILDQADELRRKRQRAIDRLEQLAQAVFHEMFGDSIRDSMSWNKVALVDCCAREDDIRCGPFGTRILKDELQDSGVPFWGIKQVNHRFQIPPHVYLSEKKANELSDYNIVANDIVMTRKGTIGNCAVYPPGFPAGIMHSDLLRVRIDRAKADPRFIADQLRFNRDVTRRIELISGGAVMRGIHVGKLKNIEVLLPPLDPQKLYVKRIKAINKHLTCCKTYSERSNALFASLRHRAFRGEL